MSGNRIEQIADIRIAHVWVHGHYYAISYLPGQEGAVRNQLGRWAENPLLDFSWDAAEWFSRIVMEDADGQGSD